MRVLGGVMLLIALTVEPAGASAQGWPALGLAQPEGIVNPRVDATTDEGFMIAGLATFGGGYLAGILSGAMREVELCVDGAWCGSAWWLSFIPFGGTIGGSWGPYPSGWLALAFPATAAQIVGLVLFIVGIVPSENIVSARLSNDAQLELVASAPATDAGMSLRVTF